MNARKNRAAPFLFATAILMSGPRLGAADDVPAHRPSGAAEISSTLGAPIDTARFTRQRKLFRTPHRWLAFDADVDLLSTCRPDLGDLRIVEAGGNQVPYLVDDAPAPLEIELPPLERLPAGEARIYASAPDRSVYRLVLPAANVPRVTLEFRTDSRLFERELRLFVESPAASRAEKVLRTELANRFWRATDRDSPAPPLRIELPRLEFRRLVVVVAEGDNQPLPMAAPRLVIATKRVRFFSPGGNLTILSGSPDLPAPRYDLALLAPGPEKADAELISLPPAPPEEGSPEVEDGTRDRAIFWGVLVAAVAALAILLARLLRSPA